MQHLEAERLAAFDHDEPTLDELSHLAACALCRAEREEYAALARVAYESAHAPSDAGAPRLTNWDSLSAALRNEGLITSTADITPLKTPMIVQLPASPAAAPQAPDIMPNGAREITPRVRTQRLPGWARAAAVLALMSASAYAGRLSVQSSDAAGGTVVAADSSGPVASTAGVLAQQVLGNRDTYASVNDATAALSRAQNEYERASLWLASNDTTTRSSDVYRARLAALDQMMAASKAALRDAPQDPVLNHYFLAAYTAREATLQQLGGALPVDKTIETY